MLVLFGRLLSHSPAVQYAAKGVKFSLTVDGPHLDEHKDQCYNLKTSLHATIA